MTHPYDLACDRCAGWGKVDAKDDTPWYEVMIAHRFDEAAAAEAGHTPKNCPDCAGTGESALAMELNAKGTKKDP